MATITAVQNTSVGDQTFLASWVGLGNADTGTAVAFGQYPDRTIQVVGTFGGATLTVEGSMDGGATWSTLRDFQGNTLLFLVADIKLIAECPTIMRVRTSGGAGTSLAAYVLGSRA